MNRAPRMQKKGHGQEGQILAASIVMMMVLVIFWMMVVNFGALVLTRVKLQNAADAAALTANIIRARALNIIGNINMQLDIPVYTMATPIFCWWPRPNYHRGFGFDIHDDFARSQRNFVGGLTQTQSSINAAYGGGWAAIQAYEVAKRNGAEGATYTGNFSIRLKRNEGRAWFWNTIHVWFIDWRGRQHRLVFPGWPVYREPPGRRRWYLRENDFHRKAINLVAWRRNPPSNFYPLGRSLIGLRWPFMTANARGSVHNSKGPMFSDQPGSFYFTGMRHFREFWKAGRKGVRPYGWDAQLVPTRRMLH